MLPYKVSRNPKSIPTPRSRKSTPSSARNALHSLDLERCFELEATSKIKGHKVGKVKHLLGQNSFEHDAWPLEQNCSDRASWSERHLPGQTASWSERHLPGKTAASHLEPRRAPTHPTRPRGTFEVQRHFTSSLQTRTPQGGDLVDWSRLTAEVRRGEWPFLSRESNTRTHFLVFVGGSWGVAVHLRGLGLVTLLSFEMLRDNYASPNHHYAAGAVHFPASWTSSKVTAPSSPCTLEQPGRSGTAQ